MRIVHARPDDLDGIVALRRQAAEWLGTQGQEQWQTDWPDTATMLRRLVADLAEGTVWVALDCRAGLLGTVTLDRGTDMGLWTPDEEATALFVHRLMVARSARGRGIGAWLVQFADQLAAADGLPWLRLDAWTTNADLHEYYVRQGFRHVRTVAAHPTPSAACFERRVTAA